MHNARAFTFIPAKTLFSILTKVRRAHEKYQHWNIHNYDDLSEVNQKKKFIDCHTWLQTCNKHVRASLFA